MAYYLTGRERTLTMSGVITGHGHADSLMTMPWTGCVTRIKVQAMFGAPGGPGGAMVVTGEVDNTISAGLTVTADNGWGATDSATNRPQGLPYDQDVGGTWEMTLDVEECRVTTAHSTNDPITHMPNYGGAAVTDFPFGEVENVYERTKIGGIASVTITMGGLTATASGAITSNITLPTEYPVYRKTYASASNMTNTASCSLAFLGFANETYTHSSGPVGCTHSSVTVVGSNAGNDGTLESTCSPPRKFIIDGALRSDAYAWPGSGEVRIKRMAGEAYVGIVAADGWGYSHTQRSVNYSATLNGVAQTSLVISEASPMECWLVPDAPDASNEWRMLLHGWIYDALDIAQAASVNVDGSYSVTLGGTVTRTLTTQSLNGYRYLQIDGGVGAANATFTLTIGAKEWSAECNGSGVATVDLCSPTNAAVDVDPLTHRWAWPIDVDTVAGDGCLWGCERVTGYTISGGSAALTVPANGVKLVRADHTLLTIEPEFDNWHSDGATVTRRQFAVGDTDGRRSYENEDGYISSGTPQQDSIETFNDEVGLVETGYVRHQGWTATLKAAVDVADGASGTDMTYNYLNRNRAATWLFGAGVLWDATSGTGEWRYGCDLDAASTLTVPAQALFDRVEWYPGCGDVFGHRDGAHRYEYADTDGTNGEIELRAHRILRSAATGIALKAADGKPLEGATVAVLEATSHTPYGSGTTDVRGEYLTGLSLPYHDASFDVQLQVGSPRPEATLTLYSRSRQRIAFRGTPAGSGLSYDVSSGMRHMRGFLDGGTIWLQTATTINPTVWSAAIDTGIAGDYLAIRYDRMVASQPLWIAYTDSGAIYISHTEDEGRTVSMPSTVGTGSYPALVACRDGVKAVYWVTGTAIHGVLYDTVGNVLVSEFTAIASGVDASQIAVDEYIIGGGVRGVALIYRSSGVLVTAISTDGIVFA